MTQAGRARNEVRNTRFGLCEAGIHVTASDDFLQCLHDLVLADQSAAEQEFSKPEPGRSACDQRGEFSFGNTFFVFEDVAQTSAAAKSFFQHHYDVTILPEFAVSSLLARVCRSERPES